MPLETFISIREILREGEGRRGREEAGRERGVWRDG